MIFVFILFAELSYLETRIYHVYIENDQLCLPKYCIFK